MLVCFSGFFTLGNLIEKHNDVRFDEYDRKMILYLKHKRYETESYMQSWQVLALEQHRRYHLYLQESWLGTENANKICMMKIIENLLTCSSSM